MTIVGAGLPQLLALAGNAKSYAERLFDFPQIGPLDPAKAELAIVKPARDKGADYVAEAADEIVMRTRRYPYFLQERGKHSWDIAKISPITLDNVRAASIEAIAALDESLNSRSRHWPAGIANSSDQSWKKPLRSHVWHISAWLPSAAARQAKLS